MKIDTREIEQITFGAVRMTETNEGVCFDRFTEQAKRLYEMTRKDFYLKALCPAGVTLRFRTDSETLGLSITAAKGSSRTFFALDVEVDGKYLGSIINFEEDASSTVYSHNPAPLGDFSGHFDLGKGEKNVCVYLPWSVRLTLREMTLDDGAWLLPLPYKKKALMFGDSITQGYDARYPSRRYASQLCKWLDAEEHSRAIGGEKFCPALAACREPFTPDLITVAYGTNDWSHSPKETFMKNARLFFETLAAEYPTVPVYAITPIWRADDEAREMTFAAAADYIAECAAIHPKARVIRGIDALPHDITLFADGNLHPNDAGFDRYFAYLKEEF